MSLLRAMTVLIFLVTPPTCSVTNPLPRFYPLPPLKVQKVQVPSIFANIENFSGPCRKGAGENTV